MSQAFMAFCKKLAVANLLSLMTFGSASVMAATGTWFTVVAPTINVNMFLNSQPDAIPSTSYNIKADDGYGSIEYLNTDSPGWSSGYGPNGLPSDRTVSSRLQNTIFASGRYFSSSNGYQQVSENTNQELRGACVGFAKFISNIGATSTWHPGSKLETVLNTTTTYSQATVDTLIPPGSIIAYFNSKDPYPGTTTEGYVIMVLSVALTNGKVTGLNVVDQNGGGIAGVIAKHFLPWNPKNANKLKLGAKNYNFVKVCMGTGTQCTIGVNHIHITILF